MSVTTGTPSGTNVRTSSAQAAAPNLGPLWQAASDALRAGGSDDQVRLAVYRARDHLGIAVTDHVLEQIIWKAIEAWRGIV